MVIFNLFYNDKHICFKAVFYLSSLIIFVTFVLAHIISHVVYEIINNNNETEEYNFSKLLAHQKGNFAFAIRLFVNCLGYGCIFTPLFLIYKYTNKIKYVERGGDYYYFFFA